MGDMPSFAEFASARFERRLAAVCAAAAPVIGFIGKRHQVVLQVILDRRRVDLGVTPAFLMVVAPVVWLVISGLAAFVVSRRMSLSKHVYRAMAALSLVAGLAGAGVVALTPTAGTSASLYWIWLAAGLVVAVLAARALWTARKRLDWQLYGMG